MNDEALALVNVLSSDDAQQAHRAIWRLISTPEVAVRALQRRLRPVKEIQVGQLDPLIADLDNNQFSVRETAAKQLVEGKELAAPALRRILAGKLTVEVRQRVESLLAEIEARPVSSPEWLSLLRGIEALEVINSPEARQLLTVLADGDGKALPTQEAKAALVRLMKRVQSPR